MKLIVNGETHEHSGQGAIAELLRECQADPARTAIMVNGEVVRRGEWDSAKLSENDRVELLVFAGGG